MAVSADNALAMSWRDSAWIPMLNPSNVMDYFAERSNLFYDRSCNNEMVKMQRLSPEQINNLTGIEYILLHVQEPILYVIRKLHRHSPTQVTPLADYYIIAGTVYQAPDVGTVINSRILNAMHNVGSAFDEALSFSRYHPSKGYWWAFKDSDQSDGPDKKDKKRKKEEPSSYFQRQRVDILLGELGKKYPPKAPAAASAATEKPVDDVSVKVEVKQEVKVEKIDDRERASSVVAASASTGAAAAKPPPEKKPKLMR